MYLQRYFAVISTSTQYMDFSHIEEVEEVAISIQKQLDLIFKQIKIEKADLKKDSGI